MLRCKVCYYLLFDICKYLWFTVKNLHFLITLYSFFFFRDTCNIYFLSSDFFEFIIGNLINFILFLQIIAQITYRVSQTPDSKYYKSLARVSLGSNQGVGRVGPSCRLQGGPRLLPIPAGEAPSVRGSGWRLLCLRGQKGSSRLPHITSL